MTTTENKLNDKETLDAKVADLDLAVDEFIEDARKRSQRASLARLVAALLDDGASAAQSAR